MTLSGDYIEMCFRLVAALLAGALIGLERSYRGRPAGFRTMRSSAPPPAC